MERKERPGVRKGKEWNIEVRKVGSSKAVKISLAIKISQGIHKVKGYKVSDTMYLKHEWERSKECVQM